MSFKTESSKYNLKLSDLVHYKVSDLRRSMINVSGNSVKSSWEDFLTFTVEEPILLPTIELNVYVTANVARVGNAGQVIGDIRFYDIALDEGGYSRVLTPYGYGKWRELVAGDYIYNDAICKYCMQASLNSSRPNTRKYVHKVDVPDIIATGTATLTTSNQPLFVSFPEDETRKFHIVPELSVGLKAYSGTDTAPLVIPYNVTREGFYVTMKVDGAYVDGTISYSARGY